jgi:hypothetical protein
MRRNKTVFTSSLVIRLTRHAEAAFIVMLLSLNVAPDAYTQQRDEDNADFRRQSALLALEDLLIESKAYEDKVLRVRIKAQVADVIWPVEPERARALLTSAFEDVLRSSDLTTSRYSLRSEIVAVARRHDVDLAAEIISRFADEAGDKGQTLTRDSIERISEQGALYLESARDLLREGKQGRALDFARRSFSEGRSAQLIWFLTELRKRDQSAADDLFIESLNTLRQGQADPNDVLYFGLYVFYPGTIAAGVLADGVEAISYGRSFIAAPSPDIKLVRPYIRAASEALLRFQVTPGKSGPAGSIELKRFALSQLLLLYDRYEPQLVAAMRADFARLPASAPPPAATSERLLPPARYDLSAESIITDIERLPNARERDHYLFEAAKRFAERGDVEGARALAGRISKDDLKQSMLDVLAFKQAQIALRRGEPDEAAKIATSKLRRESRAVIYFLVASAWSERRDYARANEMVNAAVAEGAKIDDKAQRARLYAYLAAGIVKQDALRAFELIEAAVKDINDVEDFNPSDERITFELRTPLDITHSFTFGKGGSLLSALSHLAVVDSYRTITISKSLRSPGPRALALIASCRAMLSSARKPRL